MFARDLLRRLEDRPFRPFRIHLADGNSVDVQHPEMVIVSRTSAVLPTAWTQEEDGRQLADDWRTIILMHMTQFSDLRGSAADKHKRKK
jgi:hypothetical protein